MPINTDTLSSFTTTPVDVLGVLQSLPKRKASGSDGITTDLLCLCSSGIATSLSVLFSRSFAYRHFPTAWKEALAVPMYKKRKRSQLKNYRPIALLSAVGKVCERLVQLHLQKLLSTYQSDNQWGFRKGDSTSHQLFRLVQTWSDALNSQKVVGVVFFDLAKALDKVWHRGLLAKLEAACLRGGALDWITTYLSNRTQRRRVGNCVSKPAQIFAVVPQRALSALLFTVYVNAILMFIISSQPFRRWHLQLYH